MKLDYETKVYSEDKLATANASLCLASWRPSNTFEGQQHNGGSY